MAEALRFRTVPSAVSAPAYSESLPRVKESAAVARHLVRTVLDTWHLSDLVDPAALIMSELVANSVDHGRGACIRVIVTRTEDDGVRLAVVDTEKRRLPTLREPSVDDERGRGLRIVEEASTKWGTDRLPWGKRVWAECARPAAHLTLETGTE